MVEKHIDLDMYIPSLPEEDPAGGTADCILIGGGVSAQQELLIDPLAKKVRASVMPAFAEGLEIRAAQLHNDAGMVGAVYYFRQTMKKE